MKETKVVKYLGYRVLWLNAIRKNDTEAMFTYINKMHLIMFDMSIDEFNQALEEGDTLDTYYDFPPYKR